MKIDGSVVVITGASSGIGRATALAFARAGANVVLAARAADALREAEAECAEAGAEALAVPTDVTDSAAVEELSQQAVRRFGRIDVWVNAAAVSLFSPFQTVPLDEFRRVLDVNILGYVYGARAALDQMRLQGRGVLIDVSSIAAFAPQPYTHSYVMSKAAVRALDASLREELRLEGVRGIHICTVMPATIDTPLFAHAANHTGRKVKAMPPVYTPGRVARAIVSLARFPRREVIVGTAGRGLLAQSKLAPGLLERAVAVQVDRTHLSRTETEPSRGGNLWGPLPGTGGIEGGWNGRRRTAIRRALTAAALASAAAGMAVRRRRAR